MPSGSTQGPAEASLPLPGSETWLITGDRSHLESTSMDTYDILKAQSTICLLCHYRHGKWEFYTFTAFTEVGSRVLTRDILTHKVLKP